MTKISSDCGTLKIKGNFINPKSIDKIEYLIDYECLIDTKTGEIIEFGKRIEENGNLQLDYDKEYFIVPGFVDLHTHAPQFGNRGLGLDYPLLEWLENVTFPRESSFFSKDENEDISHFKDRIFDHYTEMVGEYLANGTTFCCYFGSLQTEANKILADAISLSGQRAFVGKVCMNCNSPSHYVESEAESVQGTIDFANYVKEKKCLVEPIVTPRFAITCTMDSMRGLGVVAEEMDLPIQTHLGENKNEIAFVKELFPSCPSYASVYDEARLLTERTILAHSIYLEESEIELILEKKAAIAHCPNSNFALSSGVAPIRKYLERGIRVGLGTDISGGYSVSIIDAMRQAIIASKVKFFEDSSMKPLTVEEVFFLATLGGAQCVNLPIGNFEVGKKFDALVIKLCPASTFEELKKSLDKFVFTGDDRNISTVFINGKSIPK